MAKKQPASAGLHRVPAEANAGSKLLGNANPITGLLTSNPVIAFVLLLFFLRSLVFDGPFALTTILFIFIFLFFCATQFLWQGELRINAGKRIAQELQWVSKANLFYITLFLFFALFLLTHNAVFGLLVGLNIFLLLLLEVVTGVTSQGIKSEIRETIVALAVALLIWYAAVFLLATPAPLNAIVSCSMLPNLERGDMVVLQGGEAKAPVLNLTAEEFSQMDDTALIRAENGENTALTVKGSLYGYCFANPYCTEAYSQQNPVRFAEMCPAEGKVACDLLVAQPEKIEEWHGPLLFRYKTCDRKVPASGLESKEPCLASIEHGGVKVEENLGNDVIVYEPRPGDLYREQGDIIHRAFVRLNVEGKSYYLTKGDNNEVADYQVYRYSLNPAYPAKGNAPIAEGQLKGKVILRLPYLGYFKLFISGFYADPLGCDRVFVRN